MRITTFGIVATALYLIIDLYVFWVLRGYLLSSGIRRAGWWQLAYVFLGLSTLLFFFFIPRLSQLDWWKPIGMTFFAIGVSWFLARGVAALFFLIDDIRRLLQWGSIRAYQLAVPTAQVDAGVSRSVFMSWMGVIAGFGLLGSLVYGFGNKYRYEVRTQRIRSPKLPDSFKGIRILQLSDIHVGSFDDPKAVERGVEKALALKPDLIVFTGDLVNNMASEVGEYEQIFSKLRAPMGVYSILGNHDYGDYVSWDNPEMKKANLEKLKRIHEQMGWRLLLNEHVRLKRGEQEIVLIGVENWSSRVNFKRYGNMSSAYQGVNADDFQILLSHDPSHWETEVTQSYPSVDLTLSGHTHGMQFGVEVPGFKWSPVQYVYGRWAGHYVEGTQQLYINRGFGFLGYPGRVGILPEITLIELYA
ncbi:MAG: metallophosphoesterase [Bacteroidota bacterium]